MHFELKKGLNIPLSGQPEQTISDAETVTEVALLGTDYIGLKPTVLVAEGDKVKLGQPLFIDKQNPQVQFTAPGAGKVKSINRGAKRVLQSIVITLSGKAEESFAQYDEAKLDGLTQQQATDNLVKSGLWTAFRTRPYSKIPNPDTSPSAIFVTAMDTNPLAADPIVVIAEEKGNFSHGLRVLTKLTEGKVHVSYAIETNLPTSVPASVEMHTFAGPHPAGLVGTHIHLIDPVSSSKTAWTMGYQDVIAVGKLFTTGKLSVERVISLAGPLVDKPRLIRTRLGANTGELVKDQVEQVQSRVISGSVLSGHTATNWATYLGRYHQQISVLAEGNQRELLGWIMPGRKKFSALNVFISKILGKKSFDLTTTQNGSLRAMVPVGAFESVLPLDMLATPLLRALLVRDTDVAQALGCLELDEDDLSLCSFVCSGKYEYGPVLRDNLTQIEKEG
jgi:Na+-transporting NADH:ubiquinone oxidoreductase subunit A